MGLFNLENCLLLSFILFSIGAYGVLAKRNLIVILMSTEIMLNAINITLLSFNYFKFHDKPEVGHYFVLLVIAVAAAEAAVGLAILVTVYRNRKVVDSEKLTEMKE